MSSLPKSLAVLGGIVAFAAVLLVALLCGCPPLAALRKGVLCSIALGGVAWLCAHIALDVVVAGLTAHQRDSGT